MEANSAVLCDNLIKWLQTLNPSAKHGYPSELSDGVAIAEALSQIAPEYFTPIWVSKIKTDVGQNWRLKVSNLKKILEGVVDYHQDILNLSLREFRRPDVVNIAENADPADLGKLLQLVLSCAVNCNKKEEYITRIMELELSCQRSIMQAIQELQTLTVGPNRGSFNLDTPTIEQSDVDMKEALAQKCHELDIQVKVLQEEKMTLLSEVSRLTAAARDAAAGGDAVGDLDDAGASLGPAHEGTLRYSNMRAQLDALKDELDKVELQRDDHRVRADALEREVAYLKLRNEELQIAASETIALKDEVDALRETAVKAANLEATVASYKKRMEEHVDLKKQVKLLERANTEYIQRTIEHEQAASRANAIRAQLEIYKKQVTDLNEKLDAEITKADKLEIENKKLSSRVTSLQRERDTMLQERDTLRETVDELRCSTITTGAPEDNVSSELMPREVKERLVRLEHENKMLLERQGQGAQAEHASVQALLEDYAARLEKQRALNREANQRIMQLEATLEAPHPRLATALEDTQRKSLQVEELQAALTDEKRRANKLQEALAAREADLLATEEKYKKCVEKAKEVIKTLDPRMTGQQSLSDITLGYSRAATGTTASTGTASTNNNRHEWSGSGSGNSSEECGRAGGAGVASGGGVAGAGACEQRLLASAWYQLGTRCHRDSVDARFALLSAGHSFLARQRRQPSRARPTATHPAHATHTPAQ